MRVIDPTSAHGRMGRSWNVDVEPTLGQHMHSECARRWVVVGQAILHGQTWAHGQIGLGQMSTSSQRLANVGVFSVRDVG